MITTLLKTALALCLVFIGLAAADLHSQRTARATPTPAPDLPPLYVPTITAPAPAQTQAPALAQAPPPAPSPYHASAPRRYKQTWVPGLNRYIEHDASGSAMRSIGGGGGGPLIPRKPTPHPATPSLKGTSLDKKGIVSGTSLDQPARR